MSSCLKFRKNTETKNTCMIKKNKWKLIILPKCVLCGSKKSKFVKNRLALMQ